REIAEKVHFAQVELQISPGGRGSGFQFQAPGKPIANLTDEYLRAIRDGARESSEVGALAGYPLIDVMVSLKGATVNPEQASAMAFKIAAANAFREALRNAKSQLLEPIFKVEVTTPDESMGNIIGDLNSRRGKVNGMAPRGSVQVIQAEMPLMTMFGYATDLRSIS